MTDVKQQLDQLRPCRNVGFDLILLHPASKRPARSGWNTESGLGWAEAKGWVTRRYNIGIRTGQPPHARGLNLVVIDADLKHGEAVQEALEALELPETWTVETGGGGLHLYFMAPDGIRIANSVGRLAQHIDVRAHGGMVCAPGSIHESGHMYRWREGLAPGQGLCSMLPGDLVERLRAPRAVLISPTASDSVEIGKTKSASDPFREVEGVEQGVRNDTCYKLVRQGLKLTEGDVEAVKAGILRWNGRCTPPDDEKNVLATFASAWAGHLKKHPEHGETRRPIVWVSDDLLDTVDRAEQVLVGTFPPGHERAVYSRGGTLVQVVDGRYGSRIAMVRAATMRELLSSAARFRYEGGKRTILPPQDVVSALLQRGSWKFQPLDSVYHYPYMREDGTIVYSPGYDAQTASLAMFDAAHPELNGQAMSQADAQRCLGVLHEPLVDFPWVGDGDRAVAVALVLTLLGRRAVQGDVPLFAIRAHTPGAGKGLLTKILVLMSTGRDPAMGMPCISAEETRKRLFATALQGDPVVVFDNEEGQFGSSALSAALTSSVIEDRILGRSETARVPWRAVVVVTGNNITFRKDQARRTVVCDIDPAVERPEDREGWRIDDVLGFVRKRIPHFVSAGLRILKGHAAAGRPRVKGGAFGGFEAWDRVIRQALLWAGGDDPMVTRRAATVDDSDTAELDELLQVWRNVFGDQIVTTRECILKGGQEMHDVLQQLCGDEPVGIRRVGYELRRHNGRILNDRRLLRVGRRKGLNRWAVEDFKAALKEETPLEPDRPKPKPLPPDPGWP